MKSFASSPSHSNLRLFCYRASGNMLGSTESAGRTNSQMITNCGLMPFQDIRAETAPYWGYEMHDRRLHLHRVGHADVLFLSTQLTDLNGHCRPKIQMHWSCCGGAKMSTASGNAPLPLCVKGKEWRRKTPHTISQPSVTLVFCRRTHTVSACSSYMLLLFIMFSLWLLPSSV